MRTITLSRGSSSLLFPHVKRLYKYKGKQLTMDVRCGSETLKFGMKQVDKGHISTAKR